MGRLRGIEGNETCDFERGTAVPPRSPNGLVINSDNTAHLENTCGIYNIDQWVNISSPISC